MSGPMYGIPCAELEAMYKREALAEERKKHVVRSRYLYSAEKQVAPQNQPIEFGDSGRDDFYIKEDQVVIKGRGTVCGDTIAGQSGQVYIVVEMRDKERRCRIVSLKPGYYIRMYMDFRYGEFAAIWQRWIEGSKFW